MKKLISLVLIVVLLLGAVMGLTACVDPFDGITVEFYSTMGADLKAVCDEAIGRFQAIFPGIRIKHESIGSYDDVRDQIATELSVGAEPNIAYCYPDHIALYNMAEAVQTLDDFINSTENTGDKFKATEPQPIGLTQEQIDDFIPGYYQEGKEFGDGLMYSLPLSKSTEVLYYNKTFFDKHKLTVPTTWTEMKAVCAEIKKIEKNSIPLGYDSESNWFITMTEQLGTPYTSATGTKYLFNTAANREFVKEFREWSDAGYVTTKEIFGGYTSDAFKKADGEVGKSYMSIGSSAGASHQRPTKGADGAYPFDVGITTIPQAKSLDPDHAEYDAEYQGKVISQGPSLTIFKRDNQDELLATWLFARFLTTDVRFQASFSMASGYVPVLKSVADNEVYADWMATADGGDGITALSAKVCMDQADYYYTSPAFHGSSKARDEVGTLIQSALVNTIPSGQTVDKFLEDLFAKAVANCEYSAPSPTA